GVAVHDDRVCAVDRDAGSSGRATASRQQLLRIDEADRPIAAGQAGRAAVVGRASGCSLDLVPLRVISVGVARPAAGAATTGGAGRAAPAATAAGATATATATVTAGASAGPAGTA